MNRKFIITSIILAAAAAIVSVLYWSSLFNTFSMTVSREEIPLDKPSSNLVLYEHSLRGQQELYPSRKNSWHVFEQELTLRAPAMDELKARTLPISRMWSNFESSRAIEHSDLGAVRSSLAWLEDGEFRSLVQELSGLDILAHRPPDHPLFARTIPHFPLILAIIDAELARARGKTLLFFAGELDQDEIKESLEAISNALTLLAAQSWHGDLVSHMLIQRRVRGVLQTLRHILPELVDKGECHMLRGVSALIANAISHTTATAVHAIDGQAIIAADLADRLFGSDGRIKAKVFEEMFAMELAELDTPSSSRITEEQFLAWVNRLTESTRDAIGASSTEEIRNTSQHVSGLESMGRLHSTMATALPSYSRFVLEYRFIVAELYGTMLLADTLWFSCAEGRMPNGIGELCEVLSYDKEGIYCSMDSIALEIRRQDKAAVITYVVWDDGTLHEHVLR